MYKNCCGAPDGRRAADLRANTTRESSLSKLLAFAFQPALDDDHSAAEAVFWGDALRSADPRELQALIESEDANIKYNAWFLFDWNVDDEGSVAELFLEEETGLTPEERAFIARVAGAHLRLYEVEAVEPGHGLHLLDLWSGARTWVIERTASSRLVAWDLLGARVAPDGRGGFGFEGGLYLYPAHAREQILSQFRRLHRRYHRRYPADDSTAFFRRHGMVFHHLWLSLVAFADPPRVTTTEGEPVVFCQLVFDASDVDRVRALVGSQPDVYAVPEGSLAWGEATADGVRELGRWSFEGHRVMLDTTSQGRAERGRAWLETVAGPLVTYRATALETVEHTLDALRRSPAVVAADRPDVDERAVQELFDRQYQTWLDRPDPDLGNRTPRVAARTAVWRPRVVERLKQLENSAARAALAGRPSYDFHWIWEELGLERPGARL
jgi:hypothetical protein